MTNLKIRTSQWVVDDNGRIVFGRGRMQILEAIEKTGSINQASKLMKMSYKTVWSKIQSTEKHLGQKVVHADRKEGSRLTTAGKSLVKKYRQLKKECMHADDLIFKEIFK